MLAVLLAMLMLSPLQYAMNGQYEALTKVLREDPSPLGLQVLIVMLCFNALVQVTVHARSCRTAKVSVFNLSVLYGLFFLAHNIVHMVGGEPLGLQSVLDFTHHALAGFAIWGAWRWQKAAAGRPVWSDQLRRQPHLQELLGIAHVNAASCS